MPWLPTWRPCGTHLRLADEEILIRLWPGYPPEEGVIARQSRFARAWVGEPPRGSGQARSLTVGATVVVPARYNGFYLHDEDVAAPLEWRETMVLCAARVNGLVSNLPPSADAVAVTHRTSGVIMIADIRERIDLVFWTGETPGELIIQAASAFGREMADDAAGIRQQLAR